MTKISRDPAELTALANHLSRLADQLGRLSSRIPAAMENVVSHPQVPNAGTLAGLAKTAQEGLRSACLQLHRLTGGTRAYITHGAQIERLLQQYRAAETAARVRVAMAGSFTSTAVGKHESERLREQLWDLFANGMEVRDLAAATAASTAFDTEVTMIVAERMRTVRPLAKGVGGTNPRLRAKIRFARLSEEQRDAYVLRQYTIIEQHQPGFWESVQRFAHEEPSALDRVFVPLSLLMGIREYRRAETTGERISAAVEVTASGLTLASWGAGAAGMSAGTVTALAAGGQVAGAVSLGLFIGDWERRRFENGYVPPPTPTVAGMFEQTLYGVWVVSGELGKWAGEREAGPAVRIPHQAAIEHYVESRNLEIQCVKQLYPDATVVPGTVRTDQDWEEFSTDHGGWVVTFQKVDVHG